MKLEFSKTALADLDFWKRADRKTAQKIASLLGEMTRTPYEGQGKPERLLGNLSGYWSRRINMKDRIVSTVDETSGTVFVRSLRKHYQ